MTVLSFPDSENLIAAAVSRFEQEVNELLDTKSKVRVLLTGGTLGIQFVAALKHCPLPWSKVWLMFSDERFVALDSEDRNEHQALVAWPDLAQLGLKRFPDVSLGLESAAAQFDSQLELELGPISNSGSVFDITILGMGPDAHVASLFPGHQATGGWVLAESDSPKPPSERLSLSYGALNRSNQVWFLAAGESKLWAVKQSLDEESGVPASKVRGLVQTIWFVDQEITDAL